MSKWMEVCRFEDIPPKGARVLPTAHGGVAIFRTGEGRIFALADHCPHRGGPLSQGIVHHNRVTCPLHDWMVDLETGEAVAPDTGCSAVFPVRIENGIVWVDLARIGDARIAAA